MNRCLNERALVRMLSREETAAERCHVRLCADCAERYDELVEDLDKIGQTLVAVPPGVVRRMPMVRVPWLPAAIACATVLAVVLDVAWVRRSSPLRLATRTSNIAAFTSDLSDALFATSDGNIVAQLPGDTPYLDAALEAGRPCSSEQFLAGECNDEVSAWLVEEE